MNRLVAMQYLTTEYQELAADAGFTDQQTRDCYNLAIDMSLRQLGYQESDLPTVDVPQASVLGYLALLAYYTLRRFSRLLALRVTVNIAGNLQAFRNQAAMQVKALLDDAKAECIARDFTIDVPALESGRFTLDFLEPSIGDF